MRMVLLFALVVGVCSTIVLQDSYAGRRPPKGDGGSLLNCEWVVNEETEEATAECPNDTFVISGGCQLDQGSFRDGFPTSVSDGDSIFEGDGWRCRTTANQEITAYALCCSR